MYYNIVLDNANYVTIDGVESYNEGTLDPMDITANGWTAIMFQCTGVSNNNVVKNCYLHDMGHGGCYFYNEPGDTGTINDNAMRNNVVKNTGTSGLSISQRSSVGAAHRNIIEDNHLEDCGGDNDHPYINIGYSSCYPATTTYNIVRRNVLISHDLAGPDTAEFGQRGADQGIINQGSYTEIYDNDIQLVRNSISLLCGTGVDVHDNYIHDAPGYIGIFVNTALSNSSIHDNTFHNMGTNISGTGTNCTFFNNITI
jgi:hypothetical protein